MKKFIILILLIISKISLSQTMRYFEFTFQPVIANEWRDTSFIAATSNQSVIDSVLVDLLKPLNQRRHINGPIISGNGGYNHNSTHWFLWRHIPSQWNLQNYSIEVCDGRPYSAVDLDTAYWFNFKYFCPWGSKPSREVFFTSINESSIDIDLSIFPTPANDWLFIKSSNIINGELAIRNYLGQIILKSKYVNQTQIDVTTYNKGLYFIEIGRAHV